MTIADMTMNHTPVSYTHLRRMKQLLEQAGLPDIRFHDLRHTFATHALTSGVDVKTLSGILGHTRAAFTLDTYTHTTGDIDVYKRQGIKRYSWLFRALWRMCRV